MILFLALKLALTDADEERHVALLKQLVPEQVQALSRAYPDFRILTLCSGRFSGGRKDERVLGIRRAEAVQRVGLLWERDAWVVHAIDDELAKDRESSKSYPMRWHVPGGMKCGIDSEFSEGSDLSYALGDRPLFDRGGAKPVCFSTDGVYNNWDCVVYSPADGRFRLWYQQAHAD